MYHQHGHITQDFLTGSQEVDSSILFSSTKQIKGLAMKLTPFLLCHSFTYPCTYPLIAFLTIPLPYLVKICQPCPQSPFSKQPHFHERGVPPISDDDVIQDGDAEQLTRLLESLGDLDILAAGGRISGGVIVHQDDGRRRYMDRRLEHLPRVHHTLVEAPRGDPVQADDPVLAVQVQGQEVFFSFLDQFTEHFKNLLGGGEPFRGQIGGQLLPDQLPAENRLYYPQP